MTSVVRVGIVGCGLIGHRRALAAAANPHSRCVLVADPIEAAAQRVAAATGAEAVADWRRVVERRDVDAVVVATPNGFLAEITVAALESGKHVLVEKPMGRGLVEAKQMRAAARRDGQVLKVGLNHRYHPAIAEAKRSLDRGDIGALINIRGRYGHGGRPGYEREWRGNRKLAGGGELTDQGVHVADLIHWFAGVPQAAYALLQTAVWPLGDLEDNAFAMFRHDAGVVTAFHTSWTQWKNLFSFEVFGENGALIAEGLGKSYGPETLTLYQRRPGGGAPTTHVRQYEGEDPTWELEWEEFVRAALDGGLVNGSADDGVIAMRMIDALYRSAAAGVPVEV